MSIFWNVWVFALTAITIGGCVWLLYATRSIEIKGEIEEGQAPTTGHVYDGIVEYDNPLPTWWFNMFVLSAVFSVIYLILYPGLGSFKGLLGWSSVGQWEEEVERAEERYGPLYAQFSDMDVEELAGHPQAMRLGRRLFGNNCAQCHGADARGSYGFPNLTDDAWLWGGSPDQIRTSITEGRRGAMPAWGGVIGEEGVVNVAEYVFSLSGRPHNEEQAAAGAEIFGTYCLACHGPDGTGNTALGAPDLTADKWVYGGSTSLVRHTIREGRSGNMPAQKDQLREDRIHLLTAYVYSLSKDRRSETAE